MSQPTTVDTLRERLELLNQPGRAVSYEEMRMVLDGFDESAGALTVKEIVAFRQIAIRQRGILALAEGLAEEEREPKIEHWRAVEKVFDEQMASVLPPEERANIDRLLKEATDLEVLHGLIEARVSENAAHSIKWPRGRFLGGSLIAAGGLSLLFGWPWGSLVGAILVLAGVVALKNRPATFTPQQEFQAAAQKLVDSFDVDKWVKDYEKAVNTDKVLDLSGMNRSTRQKQGWPESGTILGCEGATEEMNAVLMTIEAQQGRVPFRQAVQFQAVLDPEGSEAFFLRERAKRGYPPF